jgi:hypothetical protein
LEAHSMVWYSLKGKVCLTSIVVLRVEECLYCEKGSWVAWLLLWLRPHCRLPA